MLYIQQKKKVYREPHCGTVKSPIPGVTAIGECKQTDFVK